MTRTDRAANAQPQEGQAQPQRRFAGNVVFFPLATLYAIVLLPASVFGMLAPATALPGLASSTGHAHEMLFGFALAVVVGNQLGAASAGRLALVAGLWALARATFLHDPQAVAAAAANIGFAALLASQLAPRLLAAAKKWRNQSLPLVLAGICLCNIAFELAGQAGFAAAQHTIVQAAVLLFGLLLLFMGGRVIAPAVAGQFYHQGGNLEARVQPRIEGGLIIAMALALVASTLAAWPPFAWLAGGALVVAGVLSAVRLWRWRLWAVRGRPDLLCLAAGYGWLSVGLCAYGAAFASGRHATAALHILTVGALGSLTVNVMATMWSYKARQDPSRSRLRTWATVLVGAAALARVLGGLGAFDARWLYGLASALWSGAFVLLLVLLLHLRAAGRVHARARAGHAD